METLSRISTMVRVVDPRYRSNRAMLFVAILAGGLGLMGVGSLDPGWASGINLGGTVVLAWALGRELDPDEPASALVAAIFAIAIAFVIGPAELVVLFGVLAIARLLLRSVGPPPTLIDMLALAGVGVVAGTRPGGWAVALVLAFAIARDRTLPGVPIRLGRLTALIIAAGSTGAAIAAGIPAWTAPSTGEWALVAVGLGAGLLIKPIQPVSPSDVGGTVLIGSRLASARRISWAALALTVMFSGAAGIVAVGAAFAVLASIFLVQRHILPFGNGPESLGPAPRITSESGPATRMGG